MSKTSGKYRIIYNNDGGTLFRPFAPKTETPFSLEGFLDKTVNQLKNTQVDVLSWTLGTDTGRMPAQRGAGRATNMYCHDTHVGERFWELDEPYQSRSWHAMAQNARSLVEAGNDPPRVLAEHAHNHGLDFFCAFRMNDCHEGRVMERDALGLWSSPELQYPAFKDGRFVEENLFGHICKLKREHPELLIGECPELTRVNYVCFDYSHKKVRDFRFELIKEAVQKYDLDGIELDFLRHNLFFKPGEEKAKMEVMSDFIQSIRAMLDEIGNNRNKHLNLCIRVVAPLNSNRSFGLDVQSWVEQGWIDMLVLGVVNHCQFDLTDAVKVGHKNDCLVYASIKTDIRHDGDKESETFRAIAANHYRAGVDGMYLFNMDGLRDIPQSLLPMYGPNYDYRSLQELGCFDDIKYKDKFYIYDHKGTGMKAVNEIAYDELAPSEQKRLLRSEIGSEMITYYLPVWMEEDREVVVCFNVADDPKEADEKNLSLEAFIVLTITDMSGGEHLVEMTLNNKALPQQKLSQQSVASEVKANAIYPVEDIEYKIEIPVDVSDLVCGRNVLKLSLKRLSPNIISRLHLLDMNVITKYDKKQQS
jgi:hypothetical protein